MGAYEYQALDAKGHFRKGVLTGDSARQIRVQLRGRGLHPTDVQPVAAAADALERRFPGHRISTANLALMTRQLSTLVRAGMPLEAALRALDEQLDDRRLQSLVVDVRAQITEGMSLSAALGRFPGTFPELYRAMVEAGEASGRLEDVLDHLADYMEQRRAVRQKLAMAMTYPVLLTTVAMGIVVALLAYVVPEVVRVFEHSGQQLPLLTRALIVTSGLLRAYGVYGVVGTLAAVFLVRRLLRNPSVRLRADQALLRLPLIGRLSRTLNSARLARSLAILTDSGVPLLDALNIGGRVVGNLSLRRAVEDAAVVVREGGRLSTALKRSGCFPPILIHMLASGEESGEMEALLERAANHQEQELDITVSTLTSLIEPLLIVVMGGVVLAIVLAILVPIFEMNQLVT